MICMFATLFELLPCPIYCVIVPATAKEKITKEDITQLFLNGNHIPILGS